MELLAEAVAHAAARVSVTVEGFGGRELAIRSIVQTSNTYGHLVAGRSAEVAAGMDRALIG